MTDVRLTATNPEDSSVVPVACNEKGELKLEEPPAIDDSNYVKVTGDNMTGDLTLGTNKVTLGATTGNATFSGNADIGDLTVTGNGTFGAEEGSSLTVYQYDGNQNNNGIRLFSNGFNSFLSVQNKTQVPASSIVFNVLRGSESVASVFNNGSATFTNDVAIGSRGSVWTIVESGGLAHLIELTDLQREGETVYPELRNIPRELDLIEQALGEVMDKLRMIPPAGWPVWDGSDENS